MERVPRWGAAVVVAAVVLGLIVGFVATRDSGSKNQPSSEDASTGPVSPHVVDGHDLGAIADDTALKSKVEPDIGASTASTGAPATAGKRHPAVAPCESETRALQPGVEVLVYHATVTWQGTAAVVLGFSPAGTPVTSSPRRRPPTRVYVLARSGCRLLSFQS